MEHKNNLGPSVNKKVDVLMDFCKLCPSRNTLLVNNETGKARNTAVVSDKSLISMNTFFIVAI